MTGKWNELTNKLFNEISEKNELINRLIKSYN